MDHPTKPAAPGNGHQGDIGDQARRGGKRPYVKPSFVREAVFEATALACGKISPRSAECNMVSKKS
jgi:hypothetical protein